MLTLITCPTCQHKFTTPESAMGERHTCPNCQSLFLAGKSVAETDGRMKCRPSLKPTLDKTMLGEMEPPIRYNCPRCKKALEAPASEAGTKKPCPACGGRLQVPAAPVPAPSAAQLALNKTLLASDESGQQHYANSPGYQAATPMQQQASPPMNPPPPSGQPGVWPLNSNARTYAIRGLIAAGVVLCVLYFLGKNAANAEYEKQLAAHKLQIDALKAEIEQKKILMDQQEKLRGDQKTQFETMMAKLAEREENLKRQRDEDRRNQEYKDDIEKAAKAKAKRDEEERKILDDKRAEKDRQDALQRDMDAKLADLKRQLEAANQKVVVPPPAPVVYPWYHPRVYPWW